MDIERATLALQPLIHNLPEVDELSSIYINYSDQRAGSWVRLGVKKGAVKGHSVTNKAVRP